VKYFICALDRTSPAVQLGIPAERTERIIPVSRVQIGLYETENQQAFVSLPVLFHLADVSAPHGIVLKPTGTESGAAVQTVLLTPRIDIDLEIPEEKIHSLPQALGGLLKYFRGAYFDSQGLILILNPEKLAESIR
jgi:hypothetical protein